MTRTILLLFIAQSTIFLACSGKNTTSIATSEVDTDPKNSKDSKELVIEQKEKKIKSYSNKEGFELDVYDLDSSISGYSYQGNFSPDKSVELAFEEFDHGNYKLSIQFESSSIALGDEYFSPHSVSWSKSSKYVAIVNTDMYDGSGVMDVSVLNVQTGNFISMSYDELTEGLELGKREMLNITEVEWLDAKSFTLKGHVSYLGYSGHPGIDQNREVKLGDKFANKEDIVTLKSYRYRISKENGEAKMRVTETPQGFKALTVAYGDLTKDGVDEKVIVYDTKRQSADEMGTEREIHIFEKKGSEWDLMKIAKDAVLPSQHGGLMGDPYEELSIKNGCIVIEHFGGSRQKWFYTHRFRFQDGDWYLIGTTVKFGSPCDYFETTDYNLSTGKLIYTNEIQDCEIPSNSSTEIIESKIKLDALPKMDGFFPGGNCLTLPKSKVKVFY